MYRTLSLGFLLVITAITMTIPLQVYAGLGEDESTVTRDHRGFKGTNHQVTNVKNFRVHTLTLGDGVTIKEYVAGGGSIFGVTWSGGNYHPNLNTLLGKHYNEYQSHSKEMVGRRGSRFKSLKTDNITVEMGGHMGAISGRAWNESLLPAGITPNDIN